MINQMGDKATAKETMKSRCTYDSGIRRIARDVEQGIKTAEEIGIRLSSKQLPVVVDGNADR